MTGILWIGGFGLIGLVIFLFWYYSADNRAKRAMKAVPRRAIAEVIEGEQARVVGDVVIAEPLSAPLSGRACACWTVTVEQHVSRGKSSYWKLLVKESEAADFFLTDGTGKAIVRTSHTQALLEGDGRGGSGILSEPSEALTEFLAQRGHDTKGWFFNKRIRYREGVAEPGETVAVVGTGRWERDPDEEASAGEGYREARMPKRLVMGPPADGKPLMLSDERDVTSA